MNYKLIIVGIYTLFAAVELLGGRFFFRDDTTRKDLFLDIACTLSLPLLVVPTVLLTGENLTEWLRPGSANSLAAWPWWTMFLVLIVVDDLTQYWWHRLSHQVPWLFALHRAHHSARYLSVRVTYRNNLLYYALMPGLWCSSVLIYLGFGPVYAIYASIKLTVIIGAHSSVPWDAWMLQRRWAHPMLWVLERTVSTPTTHAAHHGRHASDSATHYRGNFGNLLFIWDMIFGTAKIARRRPSTFGLEDVAPSSALEEFVWPFGSVRPRGESSAAVHDTAPASPPSPQVSARSRDAKPER
jgi:sterol desaturase/sphingolipid hydroxylase (fatty acid hydroxylase superfamily)